MYIKPVYMFCLDLPVKRLQELIVIKRTNLSITSNQRKEVEYLKSIQVLVWQIE